MEGGIDGTVRWKGVWMGVRWKGGMDGTVRWTGGGLWVRQAEGCVVRGTGVGGGEGGCPPRAKFFSPLAKAPALPNMLLPYFPPPPPHHPHPKLLVLCPFSTDTG